MAYVQLHEELPEHPKTKRAARLLGVSRPTIVGHLTFLWNWCLRYAQDGDLSLYEPADIADAAGWEGDPAAFIEALLDCGPGDSCGFLERDETGALLVHDWEGISPPQLRTRPEWNRLRIEVSPIVYMRDGFRCRSCGATTDLTVDHIVPLVRGGTNELRNLQTLCRSCNSRKGGR